jgi:hypothetical protein
MPEGLRFRRNTDYTLADSAAATSNYCTRVLLFRRGAESEPAP